MPTTIAEFLKNARLTAGFKTISGAAKALGMHRNSLRNYEAGERHPNPETLNRLLTFYNVSDAERVLVTKLPRTS